MPRHRRSVRWPAVAAAAAVLVAALGVAVYVTESDAAPKHAGQVIGYTPPPANASGVSAAIIGDSYFAKVAGDTSPPVEDLVGKAMRWRVVPDAVGGTGYLQSGYVQGQATTYRQRLDTLGPQVGVIVFEGGSNDADRYTAAQSGAACAATLRDARVRYPKATLVVLGPLWSGDRGATGQAFEAAYGAAVRSVPGVVWIDPVKAAWFPGRFEAMTGVRATLVVADRVHPNDKGSALLASKAVAALRAAHVPAG